MAPEASRPLDDYLSRGDVLVLSPDGRRVPRAHRFPPRECCVVDVGEDWVAVGVGRTWPSGLWERRRSPVEFLVRLDRTVPQAALLAQRKSLQMTRNGKAGIAAALLARTFLPPRSLALDGSEGRGYSSALNDVSVENSASEAPSRFAGGAYHVGLNGAPVGTARIDDDDDCVDDDLSGMNGDNGGGVGSRLHLEEAIREALESAKRDARPNFVPNVSQEEAIVWAMSRRLSLVRGPPGTGKTRVAALLVSTALRLRGAAAPAPSAAPPPPATRVLAVAHSNGAADVLLEALLRVGVPAIRAGRPASVSPAARGRTVAAVAEAHPEVVGLRRAAADAVGLDPHRRGQARAEAAGRIRQVQAAILGAAPVVVASCIGAHRLLSEGSGPSFPVVVIDEAAQTTEPALICALAAAGAEQVVLVGDARQLPPTVASGSAELRAALGTSPMVRLEGRGLERRTLRTQYRMHPALLEHPSRYFYDGLVTCDAGGSDEGASSPPGGFPWPGGLPLAFVDVGAGDAPDELEVAHEFGGRSNPTEADIVAAIVSDLLVGGDDGVAVDPRSVAVISPYARQVDRVRTPSWPVEPRTPPALRASCAWAPSTPSRVRRRTSLSYRRCGPTSGAIWDSFGIPAVSALPSPARGRGSYWWGTAGRCALRGTGPRSSTLAGIAAVIWKRGGYPVFREKRMMRALQRALNRSFLGSSLCSSSMGASLLDVAMASSTVLVLLLRKASTLSSQSFILTILPSFFYKPNSGVRSM